MASVSTGPRMGSLTPAMAPASQPITYTTTSISQAVPMSTTHYQANSTASGYGTTMHPATGTNVVSSYPGASTTSTYPVTTVGATYPATNTVTTTYPSGGVSTYPASGVVSPTPVSTGVTTYPATYQQGSTTTYPMTTTGTNAVYPGQVASKFPSTTNTSYPVVTSPATATTYPATTHHVTSMPSYTTSTHTHQVYHPDNTEYVLPPRSLRGGMRPLYDMSQVRTYEAAPVFHSAPYVVGGETHLTREANEVSLHKSTSVVSEDAGHKKKHSSKTTQGKKKFCC